jgi:hypothetical protein
MSVQSTASRGCTMLRHPIATDYQTKEEKL